MEFSRVESMKNRQEAVPVCDQLNLDISKLEDDPLMNSPIFRRLVNIVKNDMSRGDLSFRKNLIKELYFLLQIAPIIRQEHKEKFLSQVEKMYDLNDHKKIHNSSNKLNNLMTRFNIKKETIYSGQQRPKSGVTWNQNVIPFLRPYTANREKSKKLTTSARPDSSKYNSQSTKVETLEDICIRDFTTNIQEELEISKDFIDKHRTNHPEYEPVYEQLHHILKKIENSKDDEQLDQKPKNVHKTLKYPKSAITRNKEESWVHPETNRQSQQCIPLEEPQGDSDNEQLKQNLKNEEKSENESSDQEEYIYVPEEKEKPHKSFSKTIKISEETPDIKMKKESINKYSHLTSTKLVHALREDEEMAKKYVEYARTKSTLRKQINRRNQSRRLMSAKTSTKSALKFTKVTQEKENIQNQKCLIIDLIEDPLCLPADDFNAYPTYNRRQFLNDLYEQPINKFKKRNNVGYRSVDAKAPALKRPMTSYARFNSPVRFDPMSPENIKQYNEDMLSEIEKIKMKVGGKCYASTDSLMKALTVVQVGKDELPRWQDRNQFYNMVSMGKKKLKKKRRNLKSGRKLQLRK